MPTRPLPIPLAVAGREAPVPVVVHDPDATLADLLAALEPVAGHPLAPVVDGVLHPPAARLHRVPFRAGSTVGGAPTADTPAGAVLQWRTGPDAGRSAPVPATGAVAGRHHAVPLAVDDPAAAPAEVLLEPCGPGWAVSALAPGAESQLLLLPGDELRVGASLAVLAGVEAPVALPPPGAGGTVPVPVAEADGGCGPAEPPAPVAAPASDLPPATGTLPLVLGPAVAGVALAALLRQPLLLALALVGSVGTAASAAIGRLGRARRGARSRRRAAVEERAAAARRAAAEHHRRRSVPDLGVAVGAARDGRGLWGRAPGSGTWGMVAVGRSADGSVEEVELLGARPVAIVGPIAAARAVARALVVQAAAHHGPTHLRVAGSGDPSWTWLAWLPHARATSAPHALVVDDGGAAEPALPEEVVVHRLVVADDASRVPPGAVVVALDGPWLVPADGSHATGPGRQPLGAEAGPRWAGCSVRTALDAARCLARWSQPAATSGHLPATAALADLLPLDPADPAAVRAAWSAPRGPLRAPLGLAAGGAWWLDLVADGPHALVGGTTGSGKSELLRSLVLGLAVLHPPSRVGFVLLDHKGGSALAPLAGLPHVAGVVTDLDDHLAARALAGLRAELRHREERFRAAGAEDLAAYERARDTGAPLPPLARLVVVVDELAVLAAEQPAFLRALLDVGRRGRSLGLHLVLATQRPAGVVDDELRANTSLRIALRLPDRSDSTDVVGDPAAAHLPRTVPGRAVVRRGPGELETVQVASTAIPRQDDAGARVTVAAGGSTADPAHLGRVVAAVARAAAACGEGPAAPLWLPPLPERISAAALAPGTAAVLDDPARRRRAELGWQPSGGNLLLAGATARVATAALHAVLGALAAGPAGRPVFVLGGDPVPGAVDHVPFADRERVARLLRRLRAEPAGGPAVVLAVDGLDRLRALLDDPAMAAVADDLAHVVAHGAPGVAVVATAGRPALVPGVLAGAFPHRWVVGPLDAAEAALLGVPAGSPAVEPGGVLDAASGLSGRLLRPVDLPVPEPAARRWPRHAPVARLPEVVPASDVPRPRAGTPVAVGRRASDLGVATVDLRPGDRFLVAGPPGSGRTSALVRVAGGAAASLGGRVLAVEGRPGSLAALTAHDESWCICNDLGALVAHADGGPLVLAVDDAERVDDAAGVLARLLELPDVVVVAAGRADALRAEYGHWTRGVRRSRAGLLLRADREVDGELLGLVLPRHQLEPPCAGRGHLVGEGVAELVQVALPPATPAAARTLRRIA